MGNDFLIAVDPALPLGPSDAIAWCDRRRGLGADGLIAAERLGEDPSAWTMSLWNADGSRAEVSGNGLRCLGQALLLHHDDGDAIKTYSITTDAGVRSVEVHPDRDSDTDQVTVEMGRAAVGPDQWSAWSDHGVGVHHQLGVDMGNPHLVAAVDGLADIDLPTLGRAIEADYPEGINVELIEVVDRASIELRVWERGVGLTEACGSGACAAAWAGHRWGLVDGRVKVAMPGGVAAVDLVDDLVFLSGPATFVAVVEIEQVT